MGNQVVATPLFEVFSVKVDSNHDRFRDERRFVKICGVIRVTCEDSLSIDIYNRGPENPEVISLGDALSLGDRHCGVLSLLKPFKVEIDLKDGVTGFELAKGMFTLCYTTGDHDHELVYVKCVQGEYGFAKMQCTIFCYAAVAFVTIECFRPKDSCSNDGACGDLMACNVFGKVVARYGKNYSFSVQSDDEDGSQDLSSIVLLNKSETQCFPVKFGAPIALSRSIVAVPAYSSLEIEINLRERDSGSQLVADRVGSVEFCAKFYCSDEFVYGDYGIVKVEVDWSNANRLLSPVTKLPRPLVHERKPESFIEEEDEDLTKCVEQHEVLKFLSYLYSSKVLKICRFLCASMPMGFSKAEIFSITVCNGFGDRVQFSNLYGKIELFDAHGKFLLFHRNEKHPDDGSLVWPSYSILTDPFGIVLNLRDGEGNVLSSGDINWHYLHVETHSFSWYNMRICSIVRGERGYAVLHHMMFNHALECMVKIFVNNGNKSVNVYGRVVAYYDGYSYSTSYEEEFYRMSLFDRPLESSLHVPSDGSELPLTKSFLCVPLYSDLIVDCELWATSSETKEPMFAGCVARARGLMTDDKFEQVIEQVMEKKHGERGSDDKFDQVNGNGQTFGIDVVIECRKT